MQEKYFETILCRFLGNITSKLVSFRPDLAISPIYFSLCVYQRQSVKPARLIGCPGSFERKYCVLCAGKVLWNNFEPFLRNITSKIVVSCELLIRFRNITSFPVATFLWTPVCQNSAANWLPRLIWKEILCTLCRESFMKQFRAVVDKYNIKVSRVMSSSDQISPYHLFTSRYVCMNASLSNQSG